MKSTAKQVCVVVCERRAYVDVGQEKRHVESEKRAGIYPNRRHFPRGLRQLKEVFGFRRGNCAHECGRLICTGPTIIIGFEQARMTNKAFVWQV